MGYNEPGRPYEEKWPRSAHDDFSQAKAPPIFPFRNDPTTLPYGSTDKVSFSAGGTTRMDQVNSPPHYNRGEKCPNCGHGIECIDVTEHRDFLVGNAIKYLWRSGAKDDFVKDLRKAAWYINRKIAQLGASLEVK